MNYLNVLQNELQGMAKGAVELLPNIAIAVIVIILTSIVSRIMVGIAHKLTNKAHIREDLRQLAQTLTKVVVWIVGILLVMTIIVPDFTFGGAVAGLGVGAVAIGFAFQDIFENFLAGVLIMLRDKMQLGDYIEAEGVDGTVEKITLRETHIRQFSGELTIVPNSTIFKNPVKIYSDRPFRRFQIMVGVSYDTDLRQARELITQAVGAVSGIDPERGYDVYIREFGASSIDFLVRWWIDTKENSLFEVQNEVVLRIKDTLDEAGIEIPFPYITHTFKEVVPLGKEPGTSVEDS
ncbi:mechanosensitive ion channel [Erythrobacter sp. 3-20A1M]|uniref:mechanosensitive ion channel family protein n=1 Tax=Erythrobacter sp. 3-20A1M TaxID=2653850 RepID=UPI001BFC2527|nr:mechanosensitive ion channel family protein [Erythrobacter sp. 3-20A1M]QWC58113.1 mechanosensitive ion channel [Erythrobacter sp. 3-20A1M]